MGPNRNEESGKLIAQFLFDLLEANAQRTLRRYQTANEVIIWRIYYCSWARKTKEGGNGSASAMYA